MSPKNYFKKEYYSVFHFDSFLIYGFLLLILCIILFALSGWIELAGAVLLTIFIALFFYRIIWKNSFNTKIEYLQFSLKTRDLKTYKPGSLTCTPGKFLKKMVFISDLHLHDFLPQNFINDYIDKINKINPDLLLFGGDYIIDDKTKFNNLHVLKKLGNFEKIGVLGNHDYNIRNDEHRLHRITKSQEMVARKVVHHLSNAGIKILENENYIVSLNKNIRLNIFGTGSTWAGNLDMHKFKPADINIVISHHPDIFDNLGKGSVDLLLSGHNHGGGQIKLFKNFSIHKILRFASKNWREGFTGHTSGIYKNRENKIMYLSRGLGITGISMRISCPPEVAVIYICEE